MIQGIVLIFFFVVDFFFLLSGLRLIKTMSEAAVVFGFLIFVWFVWWTVVKIKTYTKDAEQGSFLKHYFAYVLQFFDVLRKEKSFGPTPLFRVLLVTASLFAGIFSLFIILAKAYTETIFTQELLLRYAYVFLFLVIIPLLLTSIKTIIAGKGLDGMREQLFGFFAFKFVYLFMYMFTFFTFIGWLFILVLSYINTKASLGQKQS